MAVWAAIWSTSTHKINIENLKYQINNQSLMLYFISDALIIEKPTITIFFHTNHVFQIPRIIAAAFQSLSLSTVWFRDQVER